MSKTHCTTVIVTYTVIAPKRVSVWRVLAPSIVMGLSLALLVISLMTIFA